MEHTISYYIFVVYLIILSNEYISLYIIQSNFLAWCLTKYCYRVVQHINLIFNIKKILDIEYFLKYSITKLILKK